MDIPVVQILLKIYQCIWFTFEFIANLGTKNLISTNILNILQISLKRYNIFLMFK